VCIVKKLTVFGVYLSADLQVLCLFICDYAVWIFSCGAKVEIGIEVFNTEMG
jgi:hypothetical protein